MESHWTIITWEGDDYQVFSDRPQLEGFVFVEVSGIFVGIPEHLIRHAKSQDSDCVVITVGEQNEGDQEILGL